MMKRTFGAATLATICACAVGVYAQDTQVKSKTKVNIDDAKVKQTTKGEVPASPHLMVTSVKAIGGTCGAAGTSGVQGSTGVQGSASVNQGTTASTDVTANQDQQVAASFTVRSADIDRLSASVDALLATTAPSSAQSGAVGTSGSNESVMCIDRAKLEALKRDIEALRVSSSVR